MPVPTSVLLSTLVQAIRTRSNSQRLLPYTRRTLVRPWGLLLLTLLLLLLPPGRNGRTAPQRTAVPETKSAWTLMIYQDADNNLETPLLANLKEMLQVGSSAQVQIVVLCDRSPKSDPKDQYSDEAVGGLPDWTGTRLLHVEQGRVKLLADWGHTSMGEPQTLRRFVETASALYPAQHYGLILQDHGSGWSTLCADETGADKALSLRDLRAALLPFAQTRGKFDLVGMDACLMASYEVAQALAPVSHWMVASEELMPSRGWIYDAFLRALISKPDMLPLDLGHAIVDADTIHYQQTKDPQILSESLASTLSVLNLDQFAPLQEALTGLADTCAAALQGGHTRWVPIARARARSEEYGILEDPDEANEEMHDLIHLMTWLERSGDAGIVQAAQQVEASAKKISRYWSRGTCRPHSNGLSIYFPLHGLQAQSANSAEYLSHTFATESHWSRFLAQYSLAVHNFCKKPQMENFEVSGNVASSEKAVEMHSRVTDDDNDRVHFVMLARDKADRLLIGRLPIPLIGRGMVSCNFHGGWFLIHAGLEALACPMTSFEQVNDAGTLYVAQVPVQIRRADSLQWMAVLLSFEIQMDFTKGPPHARLLYAFAHTKQGPLYLSLHKGDALRPIYTRLLANGDEVPYVHKDILTIEDPQTFGVEWGQVARNDYQMGFEFLNLGGQRTVRLAEVAWKGPQ